MVSISNLPFAILVWYGLTFGLAQKAAPLFFRALKIERKNWRKLNPAEDVPPEFVGVAGSVRYFFVRLFLCAFCTGFHSGWISYLLLTYLPPIISWALAGAAACYAMETVFRRLESDR